MEAIDHKLEAIQGQTEAAQDSDDPKDALIELICELAAARP